MRLLPLATVTVLAVLLVGCSSGEPEAEPTTPPPTSPPAAAPEPSPTADAQATCEAIAGDLGDGSLIGRIPDAILAIGEQLDDQTTAELLDINDDLGRSLETAPPEYATVIRSLKEPFQQVQDVLDGGGGALNMDTSRVSADVTELMELCVADGYSIT